MTATQSNGWAWETLVQDGDPRAWIMRGLGHTVMHRWCLQERYVVVSHFYVPTPQILPSRKRPRIIRTAKVFSDLSILGILSFLDEVGMSRESPIDCDNVEEP
jgi:hypothetical protein